MCIRESWLAIPRRRCLLATQRCVIESRFLVVTWRKSRYPHNWSRSTATRICLVSFEGPDSRRVGRPRTRRHWRPREPCRGALRQPDSVGGPAKPGCCVATTLRAGQGRRLVDNHDNDGLGQGQCEAIYVQDLIIETGATL